MGCDGGTIPKRSEMIRTKKRARREKKDQKLHARWSCCALTNQELRSPVVACELGRMYNKEPLLQAMIDRNNKPESINHIIGLRDVKNLKLTPNPAYDRKSFHKAEGYIDYKNSQFICPTLGVEMNGSTSFVFLWGCGCVFSERALKEIKSNSCLLCGTDYTLNDVILINPTDEVIGDVRSRMMNRRIARKFAKKSKQKEIENNNATSITTTTTTTPTTITTTTTVAAAAAATTTTTTTTAATTTTTTAATTAATTTSHIANNKLDGILATNFTSKFKTFSKETKPYCRSNALCTTEYINTSNTISTSKIRSTLPPDRFTGTHLSMENSCRPISKPNLLSKRTASKEDRPSSKKPKNCISEYDMCQTAKQSSSYSNISSKLSNQVNSYTDSCNNKTRIYKPLFASSS